MDQVQLFVVCNTRTLEEEAIHFKSELKQKENMAKFSTEEDFAEHVTVDNKKMLAFQGKYQEVDEKEVDFIFMILDAELPAKVCIIYLSTLKLPFAPVLLKQLQQTLKITPYSELPAKPLHMEYAVIGIPVRFQYEYVHDNVRCTSESIVSLVVF